MVLAFETRSPAPRYLCIHHRPLPGMETGAFDTAKQGVSAAQDWDAGMDKTGGTARAFFSGAAVLWRKEENLPVMPVHCGS